MADKENLFPHPSQVKWVAVPFDAIKALDKAQRWCRSHWFTTHVAKRNQRRTGAIDDFLDVPEVKRALENHA